MTALQLPRLSNFPRIQKLFSDQFRSRYYQAHQHAPDFLYGVLCEHGEECDGFRQELEDLLEVGERLGLLDDQMRGRLASGDLDGLYSAIAELEVAKFLDDRGFELTPAPAGNAGRVGDMQVETEAPVFVEVKAVLDRRPEAEERRIISSLIRYAEPLFDEFNDSVLVMFEMPQGGVFGRRQVEGWLRRTFRERAEAGQAGTDGEYVYDSPQGLRLAMRLKHARGAEHPAMMTMSTWDNPPVADYLSSSVEGAYPQLPDDGRPTLVIVREFLSMWATEKHVLQALFGSRKWTVNFKSGNFKESYGGDGLLAPSRRERLSAVGFLQVRRPGVGEKATTLLVFHNPWTRYQLDAAALAGSDIRHMVPQGGKMVWLPD